MGCLEQESVKPIPIAAGTSVVHRGEWTGPAQEFQAVALQYGRFVDAAAPLLVAIGLAAYAPSIRRAIAVLKVARLRTACAVGSMLVPAVVLLSFCAGY
jgi:hypothetical protein